VLGWVTLEENVVADDERDSGKTQGLFIDNSPSPSSIVSVGYTCSNEYRG
jgi:hypothetical protein